MPDASTLQKCDTPIVLSTGAKTQAQVERAWISDRRALRRCGEKHDILTAYIGEVTKALR